MDVLPAHLNRDSFRDSFKGLVALEITIDLPIGFPINNIISQHTTTAGMCILITCCALFTQLASTQALRPHTINAIGAWHAIENWGIELLSSNATRYGLKRIAQSHKQ